MPTSYYDASIAVAAEMSTVVPKRKKAPHTERGPLHTPKGFISNLAIFLLRSPEHYIQWFGVVGPLNIDKQRTVDNNFPMLRRANERHRLGCG